MACAQMVQQRKVAKALKSDQTDSNENGVGNAYDADADADADTDVIRDDTGFSIFEKDRQVLFRTPLQSLVIR